MSRRTERPALRALPSGADVVPLPARDTERDLADYARRIGVDPYDGRGGPRQIRDARGAAEDRMRAVAAGVRAVRELTLGAAVAAALAGLGGDRHEVARVLAASGVRGWPGDPDMDPLCRWLSREMPGLGVWLGTGFVRVWTPGDVAQVPLPEPVAGYLAAAAAGAYAHLRLTFTPPTVPVPHVDLGGGHQEPPWIDDLPAADPTSPDGDAAAGAAACPTPADSARRAGHAQPLPAAGAAVAGGRELAHEAYADAVAVALDLRGVPVTRHGAWPPLHTGSEALRGEGRQINVELDVDAWADVWPGCARLVLHWSERHGWSLVPLPDGVRADPDAAASWWDTAAASPVLPAPARLAAWVAAVARYGANAGAHLPGAGIAVGTRPCWRGTDPDPALEAALDTYRTSAGHRFAARERHDQAHADTAVIPAVRSGRQEPPLT
ncbi:DUF6292 family protein [Micromonospora sp. NPDC048930]|uniref:DUF6292 family protein n=1 Tax=Micromonospora sp. NPDC048930 TaxID=3364261 RepID=UPI0037172338